MLISPICKKIVELLDYGKFGTMLASCKPFINSLHAQMTRNIVCKL